MKSAGELFLVPASLLIYLVQGIATAFFAAMVILAALMRWHWAVRNSVKIWGYAVFLIMGKRLHVSGRENFKRNHKYILLSNHASLYDIPAIMAIFPRVSWLGKEVLMKIPLFGYALKRIDYIPVPRPLTSGARKIIDDSIKNAGNITVAIFPEGTRSLDGRIHEFKRGFILILKGTGLDVLPITLNGTYKLRPKPRFHVDPFSRVEITIHKPIANAELREKSNEEIIAVTRSIIESAYNSANFQND